jgi:hypothetical protein
MLGMLRDLLTPIFSGKHARAVGRPGLRWICLVALIGLVIQFALGIIVNLYVAVPAADAHASWLQEITTAPAFLTVHVVVGLLLLAAAGILLLRAIALRDMLLLILTVAGLAALIGAFVSGEVFVKNGQSSASLSMSIGTSVALACYISLQSILSGTRAPVRERAHEYIAGFGD